MTDPNKKCLTPGSVFHTKIEARLVSCVVNLPEGTGLENISEAEAKELEQEIHDLMEIALSRFFAQVA